MNSRISLWLAMGVSAAALAQTQDVPVPSAPLPAPLQIEPQTPEGVPDTVMPEGMPHTVTPTAPDSSGTSQSSQTASSPVIPPAAPVSRLEAKTENGVTYLCGGVGKDEATSMKQSASEHDLLLTFATRRGNYLADVNVAIENARGEPILRTTCDGPMMQLDLPTSGTYRIHTDAQGYQQNKVVRIDTRKRTPTMVVLTWPQILAEAAPAVPLSTGTSGTGGAGGTSAGVPAASDQKMSPRHPQQQGGKADAPLDKEHQQRMHDGMHNEMPQLQHDQSQEK